MGAQPTYGGPIVTGEAVAVEIRPAGIGSRGVALLIDYAIQFCALVILLLTITRTLFSAESAAAAAVLLSSFVAIMLGYPVAFETFWRGRTPGKAVMGLRVLRDDGGPIRFRHAFVRGLIGVTVDRLGISGGLGALVPMLFTARSKRLGDLAAGTVVVQERVPAKLAPPPPMPPPLALWASGLDLGRVDDRLALEIRHFLGRSNQLAPWARDEMGRRLLDELTTRTAPPPAGTPPWAYFSAVLAERRRREIERLTPTATPDAWTQAQQMQLPPPNADVTPPTPPPSGPFAPPT